MFFGIRDPRSGIRDGKKSGSGIRDKHPGSATLVVTNIFVNLKANLSVEVATPGNRWTQALPRLVYDPLVHPTWGPEKLLLY
jgi:hypothetical protein